MLALTVVLVVGQFVLLAAFVIGLAAFLGLLAYDAVAERKPRAMRGEEAGARVPAPATTA